MARKKRFAPNDNNLAIAYYRFSSHSQNEASIDQQRELAHEWADTHGFKIVQEYEDAAISGTTDARPGFQQMLSEVAKIRPHTLIMWKTDRLGRDKYVLAMAKKKIRDAGCEIHLLAEHIPTEGPEGVLIEGLMEAMAEYYSRQLSQNIQRGMDYNAQHALYNGHKLFGYDVDRSTKKYIPDPNTAPFVQWAFGEYASGKPLKTIAEEMNAQGLRTPRNAKFSVNMLNKMLKNRAYIGEYHHGDITVAGGMPVLVDEATFDRAQRRFAENKRKGSQRAHGMDDAEAPRYWLTGKLYCGECGSTMQGVSGTSKTGRKYYYYYCSAQRRKECHLHKARKQDLEDMVLFALHNIVDDEENVTALALDAAEYYEKSHNDTAYLEALEAKRREVEKSLANLVKVIEKGVLSDTVTQRLTQLEEQKSALNDAIGTENVRVSLCEDRHSIQAYFDKFLHADVNDPEIRDQVFEYFVDKVYLYDDKLVVSMWFSEDDRQEITWRDWFSLDEYWTDESPFAKGGGVEFDCFPLGSTRQGPHDSNDHAALFVFPPAFRVLSTAKRALFDDGSARGRHVDLMLVSYQRWVAEQLVDDRRLEFQLGRITPDDDIFAGTQLGGDGILRFRAHLGDDGAHRVGQTAEDGQCLLDGAAVQAVVHRAHLDDRNTFHGRLAHRVEHAGLAVDRHQGSIWFLEHGGGLLRLDVNLQRARIPFDDVRLGYAGDVLQLRADLVCGDQEQRFAGLLVRDVQHILLAHPFVAAADADLRGFQTEHG